MPDIRTTTRGNAAGDVKKYVHADESVSATFRLAVNSQYLDRRTGEFVERDPEFLTVWVRGRLASNVLDSVNKGQPLIVSGRLSTSEYQDKEGAKGFSLELQADAVAHDLNFGTSRYYKTIRETPSTGEVDGSEVTPEDMIGADTTRADYEDATAEESREPELAGSHPF